MNRNMAFGVGDWSGGLWQRTKSNVCDWMMLQIRHNFTKSNAIHRLWVPFKLYSQCELLVLLSLLLSLLTIMHSFIRIQINSNRYCWLCCSNLYVFEMWKAPTLYFHCDSWLLISTNQLDGWMHCTSHWNFPIPIKRLKIQTLNCAVGAALMPL